MTVSVSRTALTKRCHPVRVLARRPEQVKGLLPSCVELIHGDLTAPDSLPPAVRDVAHIVFTAGVRSGRIAPERLVKQTDFDGVLHTMQAALAASSCPHSSMMWNVRGHQMTRTPLAIAAVLIGLAGCAGPQGYEAMRAIGEAKARCELERTVAAQRACEQQYEMDYREYREKRREVLTESERESSESD